MCTIAILVGLLVGTVSAATGAAIQAKQARAACVERAHDSGLPGPEARRLCGAKTQVDRGPSPSQDQFDWD